MPNATISQLSKSLFLSEVRIRAYLGRDGAPKPVIESVSIGNKGRIPGEYDFEEVKQFINDNRFKRKKRFW